MRTLTPQFSAALQGGATTLCHCWRLRPRQGAAMGFTDHDRDIVFDNTTFSAATGLEASALESKLGFAVAGGEVSGALVSAALTEADIASGRYDGATLEVWRVDWRDPNARLLVDMGVIGEVRRSEHDFVAEVRSIAHELDEPRGRRFQAGCDADLADGRCKVDLSAPAFRATTQVTASDGDLLFTVAATGFDDGWFTGGTALFTSGANAGSRAMIKNHRAEPSGAAIALWAPLGGAVAVNDAVTLTARCDKAFATCREKFSNLANFRGFPHMPGNDVVMSYPNATDPVMDGGSLFR